MKLFILVFATLLTKPCFAVLGQRYENIAQDKKVLSMKKQKDTSQANFDVHEISDDKTKIRQYSDLQGIVFAVVWDANTDPNLTQLFGSYFPEYQKAFRERKAKTPYRTHSALIKTNNIVVQLGGHFGDIHGKAYAPSLVPRGVNLDEIK